MKLYTEKTVRDEDLGGISKMTMYRWIKHDGFPPPKKINDRNHFTDEQRETAIPAWIKRKISE